MAFFYLAKDQYPNFGFSVAMNSMVHQTYFSELNNNAIPTDGSDLTTSDSVLAVNPTINFASYSSLGLPANRYVQYRTILESDDTGTNCNYGSGATWCSPELEYVAMGPNNFDNTSPSFTNNVGVNFATLASFVDILGSKGCNNGSVTDATVYNISPDNSTWYYYNGTSWVTAGGTASTANPASAYTSGVLSTFPQAGTVYFKTFLQSSGTSKCTLSSLLVTGTH